MPWAVQVFCRRLFEQQDNSCDCWNYFHVVVCSCVCYSQLSMIGCDLLCHIVTSVVMLVWNLIWILTMICLIVRLVILLPTVIQCLSVLGMINQRPLLFHTVQMILFTIKCGIALIVVGVCLKIVISFICTLFLFLIFLSFFDMIGW